MKNPIKETVVLFIFCLLSLNISAQTNNTINNALITTFADSFGQMIKSPGDASYGTIIKIDVSKKGTIADISLSDSADPRVKTAFTANKKALNLETILLYIKRNKIKNTALLLPWYVNYQEGITIPFAQSRKLMRFNKKDFIGNCIILPPGDVEIVH